MKQCRQCKKSFPEEEGFYKQRHKRKDGVRVYYSSYCKDCDREKARKAKSDPDYREKQNAKRRNANLSPKQIKEKNRLKREHSRNNPVGRLLARAKKRAQSKGWEFNLEKSDILIPDKCPILGVSLEVGTKEGYEYTPSLDRIDNSKGYVKGNIQVISKRANSMKNAASIEELKAFAHWILKMI